MTFLTAQSVYFSPGKLVQKISFLHKIQYLRLLKVWIRRGSPGPEPTLWVHLSAMIAMDQPCLILVFLRFSVVQRQSSLDPGNRLIKSALPGYEWCPERHEKQRCTTIPWIRVMPNCFRGRTAADQSCTLADYAAGSPSLSEHSHLRLACQFMSLARCSPTCCSTRKYDVQRDCFAHTLMTILWVLALTPLLHQPIPPRQNVLRPLFTRRRQGAPVDHHKLWANSVCLENLAARDCKTCFQCLALPHLLPGYPRSPSGSILGASREEWGQLGCSAKCPLFCFPAFPVSPLSLCSYFLLLMST